MKRSRPSPLSRFRRRFPLGLRPMPARVEPVPLADVVLLLLVFFLLNSSFVIQPAIRMELPAAPLRDGAPYGGMIVTLTQEGMIFFNDQRTTWEGLRSAFARAAHDHPGDPLIVEADGRVSHGTLIRVYRMAMTAGIREVALATAISDDEPEAGAP